MNPFANLIFQSLLNNNAFQGNTAQPGGSVLGAASPPPSGGLPNAAPKPTAAARKPGNLGAQGQQFNPFSSGKANTLAFATEGLSALTGIPGIGILGPLIATLLRPKAQNNGS